MEEAAGVPGPRQACGSLGEWPLGHPRPCLQPWKSTLPQALGPWYRRAPSAQKEEQVLYLGTRLPQGLEGKESGVLCCRWQDMVERPRRGVSRRVAPHKHMPTDPCSWGWGEEMPGIWTQAVDKCQK